MFLTVVWGIAHGWGMHQTEGNSFAFTLWFFLKTLVCIYSLQAIYALELYGKTHIYALQTSKDRSGVL